MSTLAVGMREFAFATDSIKLATMGLATCTGIAVYDPITRKALLMHIDNLTDSLCVVQLLKKMADTSNIYVLSNNIDIESNDVVMYIKSKSYKVIIDIKHSGNNTLLIDSKTGQFIVNVLDKTKLTFHSKYRSNMDEIRRLIDVAILNKLDKIPKNPLRGIDGYDEFFKFDDTRLDMRFELMRLQPPEKCKECNEINHTYQCSFAKTCTECHTIIVVKSDHLFVCSHAEKCKECGTRTDIGSVHHGIKCSLYLPSDADTTVRFVNGRFWWF